MRGERGHGNTGDTQTVMSKAIWTGVQRLHIQAQRVGRDGYMQISP